MRSIRLILVVASALALSCGPNGNGKDYFMPPDLYFHLQSPDDDLDKDGYSPRKGDCNDNDPKVHPGAMEICFDHIDQDCNNIVDDQCDDDMDGYAIVKSATLPGGDCDDNNPLINPGAYEVLGNKIDDDCDMNVDNAYPACDVKTAGSDAKTFAKSMDLCAPWIVDATFEPMMDPQQKRISSHFGKWYAPRLGDTFAEFSTGVAGDMMDGITLPYTGTPFNRVSPNPLPLATHNLCTGGGNQLAAQLENDLAGIKLTIKVPTNAKGFTFKFNFFSEEYSEGIGKPFNDTFAAVLTSKKNRSKGPENITFNTNGDAITVNCGFFQVCLSEPLCNGMAPPNLPKFCQKGPGDLDRTGYDQLFVQDVRFGGATGWLTTTAPVMPGETITLEIYVFDAVDWIKDSAVIVDGFQWLFDDNVTDMTIPG